LSDHWQMSFTCDRWLRCCQRLHGRAGESLSYSRFPKPAWMCTGMLFFCSGKVPLQ